MMDTGRPPVSYPFSDGARPCTTLTNTPLFQRPASPPSSHLPLAFEF